ncbi:MAG: RNB domain-containing ribonuclease [Candidatus Nanohaloarchaea archaeon]|nr:RNB domain-containing ribonuclease [Candidatus Nanohaloarchaea archaeon]
MTGSGGSGAKYTVWNRGGPVDSGAARLRDKVSGEERRQVEAVVGRQLHIDRAVDYAARQLGRIPEPGRGDRRSERTYLIDEPGSRAEDALTVHQTSDGGYELSVHTIDVPFLLEPGGYVDRHAAARGRTVYRGDEVHPLFPADLRNDPLCFRLAADRPANTVTFRFDDDVEVEDVAVHRTAVRADTRLSYDRAADLLQRSKAGAGAEAERIADLEHLKVAAMSLADDLPWTPASPWSMEATVEVVGSAVNRYLADHLAGRGQGIFRNQGVRDTDWPSRAESYLRQAGIDVERGRLADADDPIETLDRLYWETEDDIVKGVYDTVRTRWEPVKERRDEPADDLCTASRQGDAPAWYAPVPFGHEDEEADAYAGFTRPANNYAHIVNWRAVLGEEPAPVSLQSVAENLNQV